MQFNPQVKFLIYYTNLITSYQMVVSSPITRVSLKLVMTALLEYLQNETVHLACQLINYKKTFGHKEN